MNYTRALLLLSFAFFFTTLNGCRSTLRIGDVPLVAELQVLQSITIEAHQVTPIDPKTHDEVDLP